MGYDAELAGKTQLPGALLLILLMPLAGNAGQADRGALAYRQWAFC